MEKSWLSAILPSDEYKQKMLLYYLGEAAVLNLIVLLTLFFLNRLFPHWNLSVEVGLGISIIVFIFYVSTRYMFSGMEYANVTTETSFKLERKKILLRSMSFISLYLLVYMIFIGFPRSEGQWSEILGLVLLIGFVYSISSYISLKRSYNKNRSLLDEKSG
ncbi:DUF3278 domain-containing protein [Alkalihalobacterium chitinilyticum]|uniref:DUF3278 domain-containing protein n=1 Tax=Alkalihalobacterium chitinilyticum TaxID=2980103 RepID=A0ABT5VD38_9BACI|nr:DUF3278 domain-containing protein [Alkalihalobacterium chitinilyticum]MDE5413349.1 DUF3278 domain-containing protein [Alkalihalobacterium chitinilyticum]